MSMISLARDAQTEQSKSNGGTNPGAETAEQYFVRSVLALPGVLKVIPPEISRQDAGTFEVHIASSDEKLEYAIYDLEAETYRQFPREIVRAMVLSPTGY
jgi:hypothetical protein